MAIRIKYINEEGNEKFGSDSDDHKELFKSIGYTPEKKTRKAKSAPAETVESPESVE